jgi:hypothetical protein
MSDSFAVNTGRLQHRQLAKVTLPTFTRLAAWDTRIRWILGLHPHHDGISRLEHISGRYPITHSLIAPPVQLHLLANPPHAAADTPESTVHAFPQFWKVESLLSRTHILEHQHKVSPMKADLCTSLGSPLVLPNLAPSALPFRTWNCHAETIQMQSIWELNVGFFFFFFFFAVVFEELTIFVDYMLLLARMEFHLKSIIRMRSRCLENESKLLSFFTIHIIAIITYCFSSS